MTVVTNGFGFEHVNTTHIYRRNIFFLIAMLAAFLAWVIGFLAESMNLQTQYQANSTKNRRVLSLFYLGYRIILKKKISKTLLFNQLSIISLIFVRFKNMCRYLRVGPWPDLLL